MADDDKGKSPSGAPIPPVKDTEEKVTEAPKTVKVGEREYDSIETLAKDHENLQKLHGDHTAEVGDVRAANKVLTEQIETLQADAKANADANKPPATDYESKLAEIKSQLNEGEITVEDAMQQSNILTAEVAAARAVETATKGFESTLQDRDAQAVQDKFLKANPDFAELRDTGKLDSIKAESGGMHDDFSAYYAFKASGAYEKGKEDQAKVAAGDEKTNTVLTKAGSTITEVNKPKGPLSEAETEESMLKAFEGA